MAKKKRKKSKNQVIANVVKVLFVIFLVILGLGYILIKCGYIGKENIKKLQLPKLQILDTSSNARPYAVMIDNVSDARPHSGLDKAYIVYDIIVEGNLTRLMALFRDDDADEIGPCRSARPYFVDYVMENDALYVHFGHSPQAQKEINKYNVNELEGLYNPSSMFWRDKNRYAPHNAYTSSKNIKKAAKAKGYRMTTTKDDYMLLNYSVLNVDLSEMEDAISADKVRANFSSYIYATYEYDKEKKVYYRFQDGKKHMDRKGFQYSTKNIILVENVKNYTIDSTKGRQEIENVGTGSGYYITNGWAVPITWEKKSETAKTVYKYKNGKEIKVNDGNTFIEITPKGKKNEITPGKKLEVTSTKE